MDEVVASGAESDEIVEVGPSAFGPPDDVVDFVVGGQHGFQHVLVIADDNKITITDLTASSSSSTPDQHPARPTSATADPEVPDHEAHDPRPTKRHRCPETSTVTEVLMQNCHRCPETSHPVNSAFFNNSFPQDMRTMPFPQACASPFHLRSSRASSTSLPAFRGLPTDRRARCQEHRRALSPRTIRLRDGRTPPPAAPKDRRS